MNADEVHFLVYPYTNVLDIASNPSAKSLAQLPAFLKVHSLLPC